MADIYDVLKSISLVFTMHQQLLKALEPFRDKSSKEIQIKDYNGEGINIIDKDSGEIVLLIDPDNLNLDSYDEVRFKALNKRIRDHWALYNGIYAEEPLEAPDSEVRLRLKLTKILAAICKDTKEMLEMVEAITGETLPPPYSLQKACAELLGDDYLPSTTQVDETIQQDEMLAVETKKEKLSFRRRLGKWISGRN